MAKNGRDRRLAAGNMGYGRTFYPNEPEDLAYLKQLAKETRGDENRWLELNLKIHGRPTLRDGEPCSHSGCLRHLMHPCEGCGRVGGRSRWAGSGRDIDPFNPQDVAEWQKRDRQAMEMLKGLK